MTTPEAVEVAVVPVEPVAVQLGTLQANDPGELISGATAIATPLKKLIDSKKLFTDIKGKQHVRCEGWTTLAAMMGVTPHEVSVTSDEGVYTAIVELRRMVDGQSIGRASAECGGKEEPMWESRPPNARRSMALTRATGKACRLTFSWIMVLAGYEATPAEEIPRDSEPLSTPQDGITRLPGKPEAWNGNGGKPITEVDSKKLSQARKWFNERNAEGNNTDLIAKIDTELDSRRD